METEMDMLFNIWPSSNDGAYYEVCMDPDGLGLLEIRHYDSANDPEPSARILMDMECAEKLRLAISQLKTWEEIK